jgi:hypothetical protein
VSIPDGAILHALAWYYGKVTLAPHRQLKTVFKQAFKAITRGEIP